jgi:hypothetical protein
MEGDDQVLKRKRTGEGAAPSADGNGRPALLVAEGVRNAPTTTAAPEDGVSIVTLPPENGIRCSFSA